MIPIEYSEQLRKFEQQITKLKHDADMIRTKYLDACLKERHLEAGCLVQYNKEITNFNGPATREVRQAYLGEVEVMGDEIVACLYTIKKNGHKGKFRCEYFVNIDTLRRVGE